MIAVLLALTAAAGCTRVRYLVQAAHGQFALLDSSRPIEQVLRDQDTPPHVRRLLLNVEPVKAFGRRNGLAIIKTYRDYADIGRTEAVWVVSAARPLSLKPRTWCFPIAGSFPYLGWFDRGDALRFAASLAHDGWDVYLRGAATYSTLGWFPDPILSSMISRSDSVVGDLVNDILHESVHATVYIPGQSPFNESIATFTANRLTMVYLASVFGPDAPATTAYAEAERRRKAVNERMAAAYSELAALYASSLSDQEKLARKREVLAALRSALRTRRVINNAALASFRTYRSGTPELEELLAACGSDWPRFVATLGGLRREDFSREQQAELGPVLRPLIEGGCAVGRR